jgi:hypothetical protein
MMLLIFPRTAPLFSGSEFAALVCTNAWAPKEPPKSPAGTLTNGGRKVEGRTEGEGEEEGKKAL